MNCPKCQQPLKDGALYCEYCGHQFAVLEQKLKVKAAYTRTKDVLASRFHSPLFLALTICFTITTVSQVAALITGGLGGILPLIFMIISTVGMWKCYSAKTSDRLQSNDVRNISLYDAYTRVIYTICIVLLAIVTVFAVGAILLSGELFGDMSDSTYSIVGIIIVLVSMAISIAIVSVYRAIYANRRNFFLQLSMTAVSGQYTPVKAPVVGSWFLGISGILGAIGLFFMSAFYVVLFEELVDHMDDVPGFATSMGSILTAMFTTA